MTAALDWHMARALLDWQIELGVTDALGAEPVDRFAAFEALVAERQAAKAAPQPSRPHPTAQPLDRARAVAPDGPSPDEHARQLAAQAPDLAALAQALAGFSQCELRRGARNCVFADGDPRARVMIVGEGPGADEDRIGKPFVGRAGQLLDQMFAAIGLARDNPDASHALYITNTVPWRPPGNREPTPEELAMLKPFLLRHIALAKPDMLVLMGNVACDALLGRRGITRLRGSWTEAAGLPALPMMHPAYLLRNPAAKREAWADLLSLKSRLKP